MQKRTERSCLAMLVFAAVITFIVWNAFPASVMATEVTADNYAQTIYNHDNGLSAGEANAIVETPDGYIWIGTYAGLYRYDGRNFTLMTFDSVKNVNCLFVDLRGRLFIGTNDKGVSVCENGKITSVIDKSMGLPSNSIRCMVEDKEGHYYIGTSASLCTVTEEKGFTVEKTFDDITYAANLAVSDEGIVTLTTNAGELILINNSQVIKRYTNLTDGTYYTSCFYSQGNQLYVGTSSKRILMWNPSQQTSESYNIINTKGLSNIHSMYDDCDGNIWVCSDTGIGYFGENNQLIAVNTGDFNGSIDNVIRDYQGNLWFTSSRLGVLKLTPNSFSNLYFQCNIADKVVNSVAVWEGKLYSGTDSGLDIIDTKTQTTTFNTLTQTLANKRIRCLCVDSNNHLWIATSGSIGLVEVTADGTMTFYGPEQGTVGERFRSVIELSDGTMVAAENTGIDYIKNGKVVKTLGEKDGLLNPQILSIYENNEGALLAGSDGAGIMIIKNGKVEDYITEEDGLPSGVILRIIGIKNGYLVVTSNSLCYMDSGYHIMELKQFPYSNNYDVISSKDGHLWVLGSAGIYVVNQADLLSGRELEYELLDNKKGLKASLTANSWNTVDNDILYLSCNSGIFSIDMNNYNAYKGTYRMMVDYIDMDNESHAIAADTITQIPYNATRIRLRPELLNYTLNNPYVSYYLEGFESEETIVQQSNLNDITYTNLPAGTYVFHMSVLDGRGNDVLESYSCTIQKQPNFWENAWFIIGCVIIGIILVASITWIFTAYRSRRVIEKQKLEIERTKKQTEMVNETILAIAKTVDAKDVNTSEHSERVSEYSVLIAKKLGWNSTECENLRKIALLHDIGKIGIPDSILNKPSALTDEEYKVMKSHVLIGSRILKDFTIVDHVQDAVRYHHEHYDGRGYEEGLKGEEIPKDARIICIADSFDAMTSNRVYRKRMDMDYVINELKKGSGTQFDPELVTIMLRLIEDGSINVEQMYHDVEIKHLNE